MTKRLSAVVCLVLTPIFLASCGGGGTIGTVCGAAASQMFKTCDQKDPTDQQTIWNALQGMGVSISFAEIATASQGQVESDCVNALESSKASITEADANNFAESIAMESTCDGTVAAITAGINSL